MLKGGEQRAGDGWTEEAIHCYEVEMRKYASIAVKQSYGAATKFFGVKPVQCEGGDKV